MLASCCLPSGFVAQFVSFSKGSSFLGLPFMLAHIGGAAGASARSLYAPRHSLLHWCFVALIPATLCYPPSAAWLCWVFPCIRLHRLAFVICLTPAAGLHPFVVVFVGCFLSGFLCLWHFWCSRFVGVRQAPVRCILYDFLLFSTCGFAVLSLLALSGAASRLPRFYARV